MSQASDFAAVSEMLWRNSKHLQDLEFNVEEPRGTSLIQDLVTRQLPGLENPTMLQSLRHLCLTGVSFELVSSDAVLAWNLSRLTMLTLNECPQVGGLLTTCADIAQLRLKSFELTACRRLLRSPTTLDTILRSFRSLKSLYLSVDACSLGIDTVWASIAYHQCTLREFVLHVHSTSFNTPFTTATLSGLSTDTLRLELDFFGLNCRLSNARSQCHLIPGIQHLKMLHIRRGPYDICLDSNNNEYYNVAHDLDEFCDWIFGPNGLSKLDFVAYGNFTTSSQPRSRKVFRRVHQTPLTSPDHRGAPQVRYERIADKDIDFSNDLSRFLAALEACPLEA